MGKTKKAILSVAVIVIFLASIIGITLFYQSQLDDRESNISALESQIANQTKEITEYQSQLYNLEAQLANLTITPKARITHVSADKSYYNPAGMSLSFFFNVTVENISNETINGAQVTVQRLNEQNSVDSGFYELRNLGAIKAGEIRQVLVEYPFSLDIYSEVKDSVFLVILGANGSTILDYQRVY